MLAQPGWAYPANSGRSLNIWPECYYFAIIIVNKPKLRHKNM